MKARSRHFKLGLFVIASLVLFVAALAALGGGAFFRDEVHVETYLDESVQGLEEGSPVKYRGVRVGHVGEIGFVDHRYPTSKRYVMLLMAFTAPPYSDLEESVFAKRLRSRLEEGLRVRLASQGLTGAMYLELDYVEEWRAPALAIDWTPDHPYLPSIPSTTKRITENLGEMARELADADLDRVSARVQELLAEMTRVLSEDIGPVLAGMGRVVDGVPRAKEEIIPILENLREASEEVPGLTAKLGAALGRVDRLLSGQKHDLRELVDHLRAIAGRIDAWTARAGRSPGRLLFEDPPRPLELPERKEVR